MTGHEDLLALADVELLLDGVAIVLHGVQLRADAQKTKVSLPCYRAADGNWKSAISLFSCVDLEKRVGKDHPLRPIREMANTALAVLSGDFAALYSRMGRPRFRRRCCCRRSIRSAPSAS